MNDNNEQRKVSEIILSMEHDIKILLKIMTNYDLTMKLVLNKLNSLGGITQPLMVPSNQIMNTIKVSTDNIIPIKENPALMKRNVDQDNSKAMDIAESSGRKIPVIQRIVDDKGKDLFMAEVSVLTTNQELILKTKTNAVGKWQAQLKPGTYLVQVIKTHTETKEKIQSMQEIVIDGTKQTVQLPTAIVKR